MPVIRHESVSHEAFTGGATYQTLVGDARGSTPVRVGIQTHSHPYMEVVTVLEGRGEGWIEGQDEVVKLEPGVTLVFPANTRHWFQNSGDGPLKTLGVHASAHRITNGAE
jgi:mannose-6-phosphate isomerase-like protein (cupin superfamily)